MTREEMTATLESLGVKYRANSSDEKLAMILEKFAHVVTQEDLDLNPDLVAEGTQVGETIYLPSASEKPPEDAKPEDALKPKREEKNGMVEVTVMSPLKRDGQIHERGESIRLPKAEAEQLIADGVVS
jgi:hypothetical protein